MKLRVQTRLSRSALTKTGIPGFEYCLNPYTGCGHACAYCYVNLMKRFFGHARDKWGSFVDVKSNFAELLRKEVRRKKRGEILMSSVTDCYQPLEAKYRLTRKCLEILLECRWPVTIQTKSPLILRDLDLLEKFENISVGITVTTNQDRIRKIFEPQTASIVSRIRALEKLKARGINTYVFVGPALPMDAAALAKRLEPVADEALIDGLNYSGQVRRIITGHRLEFILEEEFQAYVAQAFSETFGKDRVSTCY